MVTNDGDETKQAVLALLGETGAPRTTDAVRSCGGVVQLGGAGVRYGDERFRGGRVDDVDDRRRRHTVAIDTQLRDKITDQLVGPTHSSTPFPLASRRS